VQSRSENVNEGIAGKIWGWRFDDMLQLMESKIIHTPTYLERLDTPPR
jgi:hypothetical protein